MAATTTVVAPAAPVAPSKPPATIDSLLRGEAFREAIAAALPTHLKPERFVRVAMTAITRTPKLKECDQWSFFRCLLTLSEMGLEPDGRRAHLIPFANSKRGMTECTLILDYKGIVELAMRSGKIANIHADIVCENDEFEYDRGVITKHKINFRKPRGAVYAAYAIVRFKDHTEKCEVMSREEIESVRSRSRAKNNGPWVTDWSEMAKKTCFRRLSKWIELSPEIRKAVEADDDQFEFNHNASASLPSALTLDQIAELQAPENQETGISPEDENQEAEPIAKK